MKFHQPRKLLLIVVIILINAPSQAQDYFEGTITYSVKATGEPEAAKLFNDSQSNEMMVSWSKVGFEQREPKGWNKGKIIYLKKSNRAVFCNTASKKKIKAAIEDLALTDPKVKAILPQLFTYELSALDEFETIEGYKAQKFKVLKSGFVKKSAEAYVWIAKDLKLESSQYKFETEWKQILAAMPLQYGFTEGAVLKAEISEPSFTGKGIVEITYEVTDIQEDFLPDDFLVIPADYTE